MRQPNPVQAISQQRQQFQMGGSQQQIQHELSDLAMEIYARLVVAHHPNCNDPMDESHLRGLAKDAQDAATAYFAVLANQEQANV